MFLFEELGSFMTAVLTRLNSLSVALLGKLKTGGLGRLGRDGPDRSIVAPQLGTDSV
jgi:hypothetical protein